MSANSSFVFIYKEMEKNIVTYQEFIKIINKSLKALIIKKKEVTYFVTITSYNKEKRPTRKSKSFNLKSGNYLSSQRLTVSTFGVKELNFCVRNGYRWILFAIITAIVIYLMTFQPRYIYFFNKSPSRRFTTT